MKASLAERLASRFRRAKDFLLQEVLLAPSFTPDAIAIMWTGCCWTWGRCKTISGGFRLFERPLSSRNSNNHNNHNNTELNLTPTNTEPNLITQLTSL